MMRMRVGFVAALCLSLAALSYGQMGGGWLSKPAIFDLINPVVGKGAQYQITPSLKDNIPPMTEELTVVGKESVEGKEGFWLETAITGGKQNRTGYSKVLITITKTDFKLHRMINQGAGQQATEIVLNASTSDVDSQDTLQEKIAKWHSVGTEMVTVPAGIFSCKHWQLTEPDPESIATDIWTSEKVTPFGVVKQAGPKGTMVLLKLVTDAQDHITGPVKKYDPAEMIRQQMEKMQQKQQQKPPQP